MKTSIRIVFLSLCIIAVTSCKVNKSISGEYNSNDLGKWHLKIEDNNLFNFIGEDYVALYTKNQPFFYTTGTWIRNGDTLLLNSKLNNPEIFNKIETLETSESNSTFMFFNSYGDTLTFNRIDKNQKLFMARAHGNYSNMKDKVEKGDVFKFDFYEGYKPFTIKISDYYPRIYKITIAREEKKDHFKNYIFLIKNRKLMDATQNRNYKKTNGI